MNTIENRISKNNYGFFVRNTLSRFNSETGIETTFETWKNNTADMSACKVVDCEKIGIDKFLETWKSVYVYCECVQAPAGGKYTLDEINEKLSEPDSIINESPLQKENRLLKQKLQELENRIDDANIPKATKKTTKKLYV